MGDVREKTLPDGTVIELPSVGFVGKGKEGWIEDRLNAELARKQEGLMTSEAYQKAKIEAQERAKEAANPEEYRKRKAAAAIAANLLKIEDAEEARREREAKKRAQLAASSAPPAKRAAAAGPGEEGGKDGGAAAGVMEGKRPKTSGPAMGKKPAKTALLSFDEDDGDGDGSEGSENDDK